jgi:PAS domain S-box-containing protein
MLEVSCRAFAFFEEVASALGLAPEALLVGSRLQLSTVQEPSRRVDWDDWATLCDRFEVLVGGPGQSIRWGRTVPRGPLARSVRHVTAHVVGAEQLYRGVAKWFGPHLYRSHQWHVESMPDGRLRMTIALLPGYRGCEAWFRIAQGAIEAAPSYIGLSHARVRAEITPTRGEYLIELPRSLSLSGRARRLARAVLSPGRLLEELSALQAQVNVSLEAVIRSEQDFRSALDRMPDAVAILRDGHVAFANPAFLSQVGESDASRVQGRALSDFVRAQDRHWVAQLGDAGPDSTRRFVLHLDREDGRDVAVEASPLVAVRFFGEPAFLFVARDVTERRAAEEALRQSEATNRALLDALPLVLVRSRGGRISSLTSGPRIGVPIPAELLLGRTPEQLVGVVPSLTSEQVAVSRAVMAAVAEDGRARTVEIDLSIRGAPVAFECEFSRIDGDEMLVLIRDVTEKRLMAAQLAMTDRLASLGTLAAGVAHEINNPLTYVLSNIELIRQTTASASALAPDDVRAVADAAREALGGAERVRHIVRDLRTFARAPTDEAESPIDVEAVLEGALSIAANEIRHRARLVRRSGKVPAVLGSESRLGQVLLNLLVNAAQAIPVGAADGNEIAVATWTDDEGQVVIEVRDTGPGIPPEVRDRIFDPFFSTKPNAVGTGLGLTICHDIVRRMGGRIELSTEVGKGTSFRVVLPAAPGAVPPLEEEAAPLSLPRRRGRILIVDDEPAVARALGRLVRLHEVHIARDGSDALRLMESDSAWDIVFCDLMMPNLSGVELHAMICERHPHLARRIAFITGGAFTEAARELLRSVDSPKLEKPFDPAAVHAVVRRMLSEQLTSMASGLPTFVERPGRLH